MIVLIKETARFIKDNTQTPDSLCCAEALYGIINGSMSEATATSAISSKLLKKVWIYDNVPNCATAFIVTTIKLLRDILVAQHYWIAKDIADLLIAMPSKDKLSNRNIVFDFNATSIRSFNQKYPFRIPEIAI